MRATQRAGLRGLAIGLLIAAATVLALVALRRHGVTAPAALQLEPWWNHARWPGLALLFYCLPFVLFWELFGRLFLLSVLTPRLGRVLTALLVTGLTALVFMPPVLVLPFAWALPFWLSWAGVLVFVFLRYDLLATLVASYTARVVLGAMPLYSTVTGFIVTPVVALVQPPFDLVLDRFEVAEAFEVPLHFLMNPRHHERRHLVQPGIERQFLAMPYSSGGREFFIWGATAAMLRNLYRHRQVMEAYIAGLEELAGRLAAGEEVPPLSAVQAHVLFGESLTPVQIAGMALTVCGVALASRAKA